MCGVTSIQTVQSTYFHHVSRGESVDITSLFSLSRNPIWLLENIAKLGTDVSSMLDTSVVSQFDSLAHRRVHT